MSRSAGISQRRVCIIGLGNVLLGDDGFGPFVVEKFRCEYAYDANVEVLDLGTPGLDLAPYLHGKDVIVIVDAVHSDDDPGTLRLYDETDFWDHRVMLRLSGHDPGVEQCLAQLKLAGHAPSQVIIVGVVPESCVLGKGFSGAVLAAVTPAVERIAAFLCELDVPCWPRVARERPNLWWEAFLPTESLPQPQAGTYRAREVWGSNRSGPRSPGTRFRKP
jgi:hydrogenase maturation protease